MKKVVLFVLCFYAITIPFVWLNPSSVYFRVLYTLCFFLNIAVLFINTKGWSRETGSIE